MARDRGKQNEAPPPEGPTPEEVERRLFDAIPDLARRALSIGLSGFFLTEETIRKALGDTLPREWTDFAVDQSERTRREFLERLSFEIAQSLEKIDVATVLRELLEGRTLEVRAEIRLKSGESPGSHEVHAAVKDEDAS